MKNQDVLSKSNFATWILLVLISGCNSYDAYDEALVNSEEEIMRLPEQSSFDAPFDEPWKKSLEIYQRNRANLFSRNAPAKRKDFKNADVRLDLDQISSIAERLSEISEGNGAYLKGARDFYAEDFHEKPRVQKVYRHLQLMYLLSYRLLIFTYALPDSVAEKTEKVTEDILEVLKKITSLLLGYKIPLKEHKKLKKAIEKVELGMTAELAQGNLYFYIPLAKIGSSSIINQNISSNPSQSSTCELLNFGEYNGRQWNFRISNRGKVIDAQNDLNEVLKNLGILVDKKVCGAPKPSVCSYSGLGPYGLGGNTEYAFRLIVKGRVLLADNDLNRFSQAYEKLEKAGICSRDSTPPPCSLVGEGHYGNSKTIFPLRLLFGDGSVAGIGVNAIDASGIFQNLKLLLDKKACSAPAALPCSFLGRDPLDSKQTNWYYRLLFGQHVLYEPALEKALKDRKLFDQAGICLPASHPQAPSLSSCSLLGAGPFYGNDLYLHRITLNDTLMFGANSLSDALERLKKMVESKICSAPTVQNCSLGEGGEHAGQKFHQVIYNEKKEVLAGVPQHKGLAKVVPMLKGAGICQPLLMGECTLTGGGSFAGNSGWKHIILIDSTPVDAANDLKAALDKMDLLATIGFCKKPETVKNK